MGPADPGPGDARAMAGESTVTCRLYIDPQGCDSDDWGPPDGEFSSLPEALAAAGHPDPADWGTDRHCPDEVFIDGPGDRYLSVLAPGAAAALLAATGTGKG